MVRRSAKVPTVRELEDQLAALEFAEGEWTAADVKKADAIRRQLAAAIGRKRQNPVVDGVRVATVHGQRATLLSLGVEELSYRHEQSATRAAYVHKFDGTEELWALADGTLVIRHPRKRLWADYLVSDAE